MWRFCSLLLRNYFFFWGGVFFTYGLVFVFTYGGLLCLRLKIRFGLSFFYLRLKFGLVFLLTVENWFGLLYLGFPLSRKLGLVFFTYGSPTVSKKDEL